jgi:phosphopantetheine--protein transferase-like protein
VAIAWSDAPVGLDVEVFRENVQCQKLAGQFFCPDEQAYLQAEPSQELRRFFGLWTQKESYLKYLGTGIDCALNSFSVLHQTVSCFESRVLEDAVLTVCAKIPQCQFMWVTVDQLLSV